MKKYNIYYIIGIVGIVFVIFYFIFSSTNSQNQDSGETGTDNYSTFIELFKNVGYKIKNYYKSTTPEYGKIIIFFDYLQEDKPTINKLSEWVEDGGILILAGINAEKDPILDSDIEFGNVGQLMINQYYKKDIKSLELEYVKYFNDEFFDNTPIVTSNDGALVIEEQIGNGKIYLFSDSAFFKNEYLKQNEDFAVLLNNILGEQYNKEILIYENRYIFDEEKPLILWMFSGKYFFITFQFIILGLLFLLWQGKRFGRPFLQNPYAMRTLTQHLNAVGNFYQKTRSNRIIEKINLRYFNYFMRKKLHIKTKKIERDKIDEYLTAYFKDKKPDLKSLYDVENNLSIQNIYEKQKELDTIFEKLNEKK